MPMNTANKLTLLRVFLIPVFLVVMYWGFPGYRYVALAVYVVACLTDLLDGYIARHYNQVTDFGKFLDPLADKLLVTAAILCFVGWGQMSSVIALVIIAREFAVTGLRLIAVGQGRVIAAAKSGKIKTFSSIVALCVMMTDLTWVEIIPGVLKINDVAILVMLVTTLWSGIEYFWKNRDVLSWKG